MFYSVTARYAALVERLWIDLHGAVYVELGAVLHARLSEYFAPAVL